MKARKIASLHYPKHTRKNGHLYFTGRDDKRNSGSFPVVHQGMDSTESNQCRAGALSGPTAKSVYGLRI
jgi:hypothetical protein